MLYPLIAISLIVLTGHPTAVSAQADTPSPSQHPGQELDSAVQRTSQGGYWGAALIVRGGEVLLYKGYGFADCQDTPNTPATLFEIASLSKQFTAAGIYRLAMDGQLQIDDKVSEYLPAFVDEKAPITIHQLLTYTSGIPSSLGLPYASDATRDELIEDRDGNRIVGNRITLVVADAAKSSWLVISKLSDQAAADLLLGLENTLRK